jgi:hypothetical protein
MITARNYAAQAEKGLLEYRNMLDDEFIVDKSLLNAFSAGISRAVHFALPDGGSIFDDDLRGIAGARVRLPFPEITIEYYTAPELQKESKEFATEIVTKRVIYAFEISKGDLDRSSLSHDKTIAQMFRDDEEVQIMIFSAFFMNSRWVPCLSCWLMPESWDNIKDTENFPVDIRLVDCHDKSKMTGSLRMLCPGLCDELASQIGADEAFKYLAHDIAGEVRAVLELIEALSCSNVNHESLEAVDVRKNEKRRKAGKLPIYETRFLTIDPLKSAGGKGKSSAHADRNGPRQHLRRGHIRRLPDKNIWVNSCVVGSISNGRVDKSYRVGSL